VNALLSSKTYLPSKASRWIWLIMCCWLAYTFSTLAWYLLNDPAFMASICREK
jgi:CHASE2 domain-containing sensor protein